MGFAGFKRCFELFKFLVYFFESKHVLSVNITEVLEIFCNFGFEVEKCISSEGIKEPKDNKYRNQSDAQMKVSILRLRLGLPEGE